MSDTLLRPGRQLGPFLIESELGRGGMAVVYRAVRGGAMDFRKTVALKVVHPSKENNKVYIDSLVDEARLGGFLRHENLVQIFTFERIENRYCMAMEYVDGPTLHWLMRRLPGRRMPLGPALDVTLGACRGLAYAHTAVSDRGKPLVIVHRDLKPDNIILGWSGRAHVMDFGVAHSTADRRAETEAGMVKGTPLYMSPEQVRGRELDPRSDQFSLASVLAEILLGKVVFEADNAFDVMTSIARGRVGRSLDELAEVDPRLLPIFERAWAVSPDDRYPDMLAFGETLGELRAELPRSPDIAEILKDHQFDQGSSPIPAVNVEVLKSTVRLPSQALAEAMEKDPSEVLARSPPVAKTGTGKVRVLSKKVCLLGAFGVGKTSLVARFVHAIFSEKYKTTVGVKIDKKLVELDYAKITMVLWDLAGDDQVQKVKSSHLRGSGGYLLVIDGTRRDTYDTALAMRERLAAELGDLPFVVAVNKADLVDRWVLTDQDLAKLEDLGGKVFLTSALDGANVEEGFLSLATMLADA